MMEVQSLLLFLYQCYSSITMTTDDVMNFGRQWYPLPRAVRPNVPVLKAPQRLSQALIGATVFFLRSVF